MVLLLQKKSKVSGTWQARKNNNLLLNVQDKTKSGIVPTKRSNLYRSYKTSVVSSLKGLRVIFEIVPIKAHRQCFFSCHMGVFIQPDFVGVGFKYVGTQESS